MYGTPDWAVYHLHIILLPFQSHTMLLLDDLSSIILQWRTFNENTIEIKIEIWM